MAIPLKSQRLTLYSTAMGIKKNKLWWLLLAIPFLIGCPFGEDRCFEDFTRVAKIDDLATLRPLKDTFVQGEIMTYELIIPDSIQFHYGWISLYTETNDSNPWLVTGSGLFLNNLLVFEYGHQGNRNNWFHLDYIPEERVFKLKIMITLKRIGEYQIWADTNETTFKGKDKCERYRIDTKIKGAVGGRNLLEFTIIP